MVVAPMAADRADQMAARILSLDQWDDKAAVAGSHKSIGMATAADCPEAYSFAPVVRMTVEHQSSHHPVVGVVVAIVTMMAGSQTDFAALIGARKQTVRPDVALLVPLLTGWQAAPR